MPCCNEECIGMIAKLVKIIHDTNSLIIFCYRCPHGTEITLTPMKNK